MKKRLKWSRDFLDKVIRKYLREFDPVEKFVDYQLSSLAGSYDVKLSSLGVRMREYVASPEDALIRAIDQKYTWADSAEGVMWVLYMNGYTYKAIAEIFDCAISTVHKMVSSFMRRIVF